MTTTTPVLQQPSDPKAVTIDFETTKEVGFYSLVWRRFRARKIALVAAIVLGVLILASLIGPILLPAECPDLSPGQLSLGPFSTGQSTNPTCGVGSHFHLLGTDDNGRDLLLRNLEGGRISLLVGFSVMAVTMFVATVLGALAGFFGGFVDTIITAAVNGVLSIPSILILVIFVKAVNPSGDRTVDFLFFHLGPQATVIAIIVLAISIISWPSTARIVRSVILSVREKEFVEAARAVGTSRPRIIMRHLIPNALGPIVVSASLTIGAAVLTESAISFLGYGINPPTATWGNILNQGRELVISGTTAGFFFDVWPGLLILTTVLCFNYVGDALRDAFDPRSIER